jgi:hypothetical protein
MSDAANVEKKAELRRFRDRFTREIERQAQELASRSCRQRLDAVAEALRALGLEPALAVRVVEVWEDRNGLLPPKVIVELAVTTHEGVLRHHFDVPVGPFHCPDKIDRIFELCMLRAEADQELRGEGDGHVLDRMTELASQIGMP